MEKVFVGAPLADARGSKQFSTLTGADKQRPYRLRQGHDGQAALNWIVAD